MNLLPAGGAGSGRPTTASTVAIRSSRRCSLGVRQVLTTRFQVPVPGIPKFTRSEILGATPDGAGTEFTVNLLRPSTAKDRAKLEEIGPMLGHAYGDGLAVMLPMIEADLAARAAAAADAPEPELPVSAGRNVRYPVMTR